MPAWTPSSPGRAGGPEPDGEARGSGGRSRGRGPHRESRHLLAGGAHGPPGGGAAGGALPLPRLSDRARRAGGDARRLPGQRRARLARPPQDPPHPLPPGVRRRPAPPRAHAARDARVGGGRARRPPQRRARPRAYPAAGGGDRHRAVPDGVHRRDHRAAGAHQCGGTQLRPRRSRAAGRARRLRHPLRRRGDLQGHRAARAAHHRPRVQSPEGLLERAGRAGAGLSGPRRVRRADLRAVRALRAAPAQPARALRRRRGGVRAAGGRGGATPGDPRGDRRPAAGAGRDRGRGWTRGCAACTTRACG
jgi:hypothetical protein